MQNLIKPGGFLIRLGNRLADLMILNLLTVACSLPVVTAGPAFTAMHYVLLKLYRGENPVVARAFFQSFRRELKTGIGLWLLYLTAGAAVAFDYLYLWGRPGEFHGFFVMALYCAVFVLLFSLSWGFVLLSRYSRGLWGILKETFLVGVANLGSSLLMMVLTVLPYALLLAFPVGTPVFVLIGLSGTGYLRSMLYSQAFDRCEYTKEALCRIKAQRASEREDRLRSSRR